MSLPWMDTQSPPPLIQTGRMMLTRSTKFISIACLDPDAVKLTKSTPQSSITMSWSVSVDAPLFTLAIP